MEQVGSNPMLVQMDLYHLGKEVERIVRKVIREEFEPPEPQRYCGTMQEFSNITGVSIATIWRWVQDGTLKGAVHTHGHKSIVDLEKALLALDQHPRCKKAKTIVKARLNLAEKLSTMPKKV